MLFISVVVSMEKNEEALLLEQSAYYSPLRVFVRLLALFFFFKAKWPFLISYPILSSEFQRVGAERIYGSSAAPWSGWGLLNASSCSAGS